MNTKTRDEKFSFYYYEAKKVENFTNAKAPSIRTRNLNVDDNSLNIQTNTLDDEDAKMDTLINYVEKRLIE